MKISKDIVDFQFRGVGSVLELKDNGRRVFPRCSMCEEGRSEGDMGFV